MDRHGCVKSNETKANQVVKKLCYLLLLFVSLLLSQLHSFFLSFFSLAPTEAAERQVQCQGQCQKQCQESLGTTGDEKGRELVAQGIGIDAALRPDVAEKIALMVVK